MHKTKHSLKHHASLTYTPMWLLYMYMYMLLYRDRKCLETDFTKYCSNECLISAFLKICCKKLSDLLEGIQKLSCTKKTHQCGLSRLKWYQPISTVLLRKNTSHFSRFEQLSPDDGYLHVFYQKDEAYLGVFFRNDESKFCGVMNYFQDYLTGIVSTTDSSPITLGYGNFDPRLLGGRVYSVYPRQSHCSLVSADIGYLSHCCDFFVTMRQHSIAQGNRPGKGVDVSVNDVPCFFAVYAPW